MKVFDCINAGCTRSFRHCKQTVLIPLLNCHHYTGIHQQFTFECEAYLSWWRHQMEIFSASLAICAGNSPVPGEFPAQRPVTRSFGVFFDLRPNKRLSKQQWGWWFETPMRSLWRHCNVLHLFGSHIYYTSQKCPGIILCLRPANEKWHYNVTSFLICWAHAQSNPWCRPNNKKKKTTLEYTR